MAEEPEQLGASAQLMIIRRVMIDAFPEFVWPENSHTVH
jgi:hypothetical protein